MIHLEQQIISTEENYVNNYINIELFVKSIVSLCFVTDSEYYKLNFELEVRYNISTDSSTYVIDKHQVFIYSITGNRYIGVDTNVKKARRIEIKGLLSDWINTVDDDDIYDLIRLAIFRNVLDIEVYSEYKQKYDICGDLKYILDNYIFYPETPNALDDLEIYDDKYIVRDTGDFLFKKEDETIPFDAKLIKLDSRYLLVSSDFSNIKVLYPLDKTMKRKLRIHKILEKYQNFIKKHIHDQVDFFTYCDHCQIGIVKPPESKDIWYRKSCEFCQHINLLYPDIKCRNCESFLCDACKKDKLNEKTIELRILIVALLFESNKYLTAEKSIEEMLLEFPDISKYISNLIIWFDAYFEDPSKYKPLGQMTDEYCNYPEIDEIIIISELRNFIKNNRTIFL